MKILHITNLYPSAKLPDYGVFVKEQIESLNGLDMFENDIYHIDVETGGATAYFKAIRDLRSLKKKYDVYHSHHIFSGLVCILAGFRSKLVVSYLSNGYDVGEKLKFFGPIIYFIVSFFGKALITKLPRSNSIFAKKFYYIPNGVDEEIFQCVDKLAARKKLGISSKALVLLFVSSKSIDRPEKRKDLFDNLIKYLSNSDRLNAVEIRPIYLCNVSREDIPVYFNSADVHLLLSDREGSPNSVKEALSCGCPVLARSVGDVSNLLDQVPNCDLVDIDNLLTKDTIERISYLGKLTPEKRMDIRRVFLKKSITKKKVMRKIEEVYRNI